ncbi:MAG TPA: electron transfer flavoprotein subunit beta, partial [Lachnospiraceae bacterium]|nr:electron transfer flavoprotein subunit beta [Lachnospiraceae bacterium]
EILTLQDLPDRDPARYGRQGSGTRVVKIFSPREPEQATAVSMNGKEAAACILGWLDEPAKGGVL